MIVDEMNNKGSPWLNVGRDPDHVLFKVTGGFENRHLNKSCTAGRNYGKGKDMGKVSCIIQTYSNSTPKENK